MSHVYTLPFISFSQTLVTTMNTAKNVVLEEFTGIYCQFCPDGHRIAEELSSNNPDRVDAMMKKENILI